MDRRTVLQGGAAAMGAGVLSTATAKAAERELEALLDRYVALKNARDAGHCDELFTIDYIENTGRNPSGLPALIANWKAQFEGIPDLRVALEDRIIAGDKVVARMTYAGTHTKPFFQGLPPTGKRFTFGTIDIWRVAGGKLAEHWDQVDFAGLARQLRSA